MTTTTITWTVYDGTEATRPHNIKKDYYDCAQKSRNVIERQYLLIRAGETAVEDQAFSLRPVHKWKGKKWRCTCRGGCEECHFTHWQDNEKQYFAGWQWESAWLTSDEDNLEYPLQTGDMFAPWPAAPQQ